ncbi:MAG: helix-turn-helix transcriptional regulator [Nitrospinaceae bacterium]
MFLGLKVCDARGWMSIQAKNLKIIRKALGCTQSIMSGLLKVGFRTYVRYEAGERDATVAVLVKISKLGNISLERLLTSEIDKNDIFPVQKTYKDLSSDEVSVVNFKEGLVIFKNPSRQELITLEDSERKILTLFRKMSPQFQKNCISNMGEIVESEKGLRSRGKKEESPKNLPKIM